jgi:hypothetical protein
MFCPTCRYEYKEGIDKCPDCGVGLVKVLPPMAKKVKTEDFETEEFTRVLNQREADILMSALNRRGIECMIRHRTPNNDESLLPLTSRAPGALTSNNPFGWEGIIMINRKKRSEASEVLKEIRKSMKLDK